MLEFKAFSHSPLSANVCMSSTCCTIMANTNINPMQQDSSLFSQDDPSCSYFLPHQCRKVNKVMKKWRYITSRVGLTLFSTNKICNGPLTWSILISHYAWGHVTTQNDYPNNTHDTTFKRESRAFTIIWSQPLAYVWSALEFMRINAKSPKFSSCLT